MDHLRKYLADNLLKLRKKSGLTQAELAELSGLSVGYIQKIEYMSAWPSAETFESIAKVLSVSESDLFKNTTEKNAESDLNKYELLSRTIARLATLNEEQLDDTLAFITALVTLDTEPTPRGDTSAS